jgi:hypothetical protein|tara:strand:- start:197 stop:388 length:192 start_codon:yes stop_codon:yes gene_type:complete
MRKQWTDDQVLEYEKCKNIDEIRHKIIDDLIESLKWAHDGDFRSAFRHASGAVQVMYNNECEL